MAFNAKILAEYTAPKSWKLFREVSFEFDLNNDDVALSGQTQATITAPKSPANELPVEEPISDTDEPIEE